MIWRILCSCCLGVCFATRVLLFVCIFLLCQSKESQPHSMTFQCSIKLVCQANRCSSRKNVFSEAVGQSFPSVKFYTWKTTCIYIYICVKNITCIYACLYLYISMWFSRLGLSVFCTRCFHIHTTQNNLHTDALQRDCGRWTSLGPKVDQSYKITSHVSTTSGKWGRTKPSCKKMLSNNQSRPQSTQCSWGHTHRIRDQTKPQETGSHKIHPKWVTHAQYVINTCHMS